MWTRSEIKTELCYNLAFYPMEDCQVKEYYQTLARYNCWANQRLDRAINLLSDAQYRQDYGAFFRSIQGTLNHILVADKVWLHRITGEGDCPSHLDAILYDDLDLLRAARAFEDQRIVDTVSTLNEQRLCSLLKYCNLKGERFEQPLMLVLGHLFNHQTHHRGQVHTLLTQLGCEAPALDLIYFLRQPAALLQS